MALTGSCGHWLGFRMAWAGPALGPSSAKPGISSCPPWPPGWSSDATWWLVSPAPTANPSLHLPCHLSWAFPDPTPQQSPGPGWGAGHPWS